MQVFFHDESIITAAKPGLQNAILTKQSVVEAWTSKNVGCVT